MALIRPLAWEPPYAVGGALKSTYRHPPHTHTHNGLLKITKCNSKIIKWTMRSSCCGAAETNLTRNHEFAGSSPGLAQWVKDLALW